MFIAQRRHLKHMPEYELLENREQLEDYSHILYWGGDFLNNPVYGYTSFPSRSKKYGLATSRAEAIEHWKELFLPPLSWSGNRKIFSLGSNFQHNFTASPDDYLPILKRLEESFTGFYVRDPFSCQNLSRSFTFQGMRNVELGMDCAFLQRRRNPESDRKFRGSSGYFVYFLHRSQLKDPTSLIKAVEDSSGLKGVNLDNWLLLPRGKWERSFAQMKKLINRSSFVLSDTYHVCVNAMHSRTPVIGLGRHSPEQKGTLGELKKRTLFEMFSIEDHYYEFSRDVDERTAYSTVTALVDQVLWDHKAVSDPYYMVDARSRQFTDQLEKILNFN